MSLSSITRSVVTTATNAHKNIVVAVQLQSRATTSVDVQKILTNYGCSIGTRVGLHQVSPDYCAPHGMLLLNMTGQETEVQKMIRELGGINGVQVKSLEFSL
eukprot:gnl/Dysnectes_brevis/1962_a2253_1638.p1 GENE.gnl/Dysnectes_brevis/1962_a2253_1638~~gnl/Dysnectes_brevis/1962_a2253_1638.p1  ORF type:complete len:102 (-),score=13.35 gnl/Dysnectes_brevis/1962_a2253_1638:69-374(-)